MAGVLIQTPKASGLGGTIGGGGDGSGGGYRTRRGLERQIYWTTWVLTAAFLICSLALTWLETLSRNPPFPPAGPAGVVGPSWVPDDADRSQGGAVGHG